MQSHKNTSYTLWALVSYWFAVCVVVLDFGVVGVSSAQRTRENQRLSTNFSQSSKRRQWELHRSTPTKHRSLRRPFPPLADGRAGAQVVLDSSSPSLSLIYQGSALKEASGKRISPHTLLRLMMTAANSTSMAPSLTVASLVFR